jgi:hypothetical protein
MLQQVLFWVSYGLLMIIWWGMLAYWMFPLVDKWLESVTDGDLKGFLCEKYRNPFLNKFGLMEKTDRWGDVDSNGEWNYMFEGAENHLDKNNLWSAIVVWWIALLGLVLNFISYFIQGMNVLFDKQKGYTLHEHTIKLSEFISTELAFPMIVVLVLILLNTTLKKLYKFGKKVKPLVDKINQEN